MMLFLSGSGLVVQNRKLSLACSSLLLYSYYLLGKFAIVGSVLTDGQQVVSRRTEENRECVIAIEGWKLNLSFRVACLPILSSASWKNHFTGLLVDHGLGG